MRTKYGDMKTIDVYLKITFIVLAFPAFMLACTPVTNQHQIITTESLTPTNKTYPNTPSITPTITLTPTLALPPIEILATPTEGIYSIKPNNAHRVRELGTVGFGKAYESVWSPNDEHLAIKTSSGLALYDTETWNLVKVLDPSISERFEWSPNGKLLITASLYSGEDQIVHLFDGDTLDQIKVFNNGRDYSLTSNGEKLAIFGDRKTSFYDLNTLKLISSVSFGTSNAFSSFNPDGETFAVLDGENIQIWDTYTGKTIQSLNNAIENGDWIKAFMYSPSGENLLYLATRGGFDYFINIWDISTNEKIYTSQGFLEFNEAVDATFSPDGNRAAVLIYQTIYIIDSKTGKAINTISLPNIDDFIDSSVKVEFSSDGQKLITTAGIFDIDSGKQLNSQGFNEFEISSDGRMLAGSLPEQYKNIEGDLISDDSGIMLWDIHRDKIINSISGMYNWINRVSLSSDGSFITSSDEYENLRIHDVESGEIIKLLDFGADSNDLAFSPLKVSENGYILVVSEETGQIRVWDTKSNKILAAFYSEGHYYDEENPIAVSPDGKYLAYFSPEADSIQVIDLNSGRVLRTLSGAGDRLDSLAFSPDGENIAAYSDYSLYIWDIATGQLLKKLSGINSDYIYVNNENQVVSTYKNTIHIWDLGTGTSTLDLTKENPEAEEWYTSFAVSSDGQLLAAGTSNALIDIWDSGENKLLRTLRGHEIDYFGRDEIPMGDISSLDFNPYNHLLASSGIDCTVRIWDADSGKLIKTYPGMGTVEFSPDGNVLAFDGCDGKIHLYGISNSNK